MVDVATYKYVIVGAGLAGASAIEGIREVDREGSILLLGREPQAPYHRPPLSKKLWSGEEKAEDVFVEAEAFYPENRVERVLGAEVVALDRAARTLTDRAGNRYRYESLLVATGGEPRRLDVPGGGLEEICYFRTLADYLRARRDATTGKSALVVGGGFIGSEIAASLRKNDLEVTMLFPDPYLCRRVFPEGLGRAIQASYIERGIRVLTGDAPASFERRGAKILTKTRAGAEIAADLVIAGVGITPSVELARRAGLAVENGIVVDETLRTEDPRIFAAGDNASFPYAALGVRTRVEHWDNALSQGKQAGRNMAGAREPYLHMPYFFSDLFEFGYEAVGEVDARLETVARWEKENETGVIFYLKNRAIRGVMMCNVWEKVDAARALVRAAEPLTEERLRSADPLAPPRAPSAKRPDARAPRRGGEPRKGTAEP
jgi:NADPH-dependent 2,4-dienoyl-CoA reductase/sulfur reductase-like enzyme